MTLDESKIDNRILLIIGNGFDLHCNLHSKFSNFMETKVLQENYAFYKPFLLFKKHNIWYYLLTFTFYYKDLNHFFIFKDNRDPKWMDVEEYIKDLLCEKNTVYTWMNDLFLKLKTNSVNSEALFPFYRGNECKQVIAEYLDGIVMKYNNLIDLMFEELTKFENDFAEYLKEQTKNTEYYSLAKKTLDSFKFDKSYDELYVWSFNYTNPVYDYDNCLFQNIHGTLDDANNRIIIGIDQNELSKEDLDENKGIIRFTKAWKKLKYIGPVNSLPDKNRINYISIYGHSLGKQDYSYFHSIFNYYDIINNQSIKIIFYFSDYVKDKNGNYDYEKNKKNQLDYVDSIFRLLLDYASNSIEENESRTLITRLLLERRIMIQEL